METLTVPFIIIILIINFKSLSESKFIGSKVDGDLDYTFLDVGNDNKSLSS